MIPPKVLELQVCATALSQKILIKYIILVPNILYVSTLFLKKQNNKILGTSSTDRGNNYYELNSAFQLIYILINQNSM